MHFLNLFSHQPGTRVGAHFATLSQQRDPAKDHGSKSTTVHGVERAHSRGHVQLNQLIGFIYLYVELGDGS